MKPKSYKIAIERDWSLEDFYIFSRTFEQVYFFAHSTLVPRDEFDQERIERAYAGFPWQGGYSSVNFFNNLKYIVPKPNRPNIVSLHYSSPGWIELSLSIAVVLAVAKLVKAVSGSLREANSTYHQIVTGLQKRKLLRIKASQEEIALRKSELAYVKECAETMSDLLGFKSVDEVHQLTGNPYKSIKILLAVYRRVRTLAEYNSKGKIRFPK